MAAQPFAIPGFTDPVSSLSHLIGAATFALLAIPLLRKGHRARHDDGWRPGKGHLASLYIFAFSAVFLLCMSGTYHLLDRPGSPRNVLQRLDHAAIFILIAGTFTPIHSILFRGPWRWGILLLIWTLAVLGVTLKSIFFNETPQWLGLILYIGMGWIGIATFTLLAKRFSFKMVRSLVLGGIAYTAGALIDGLNAPNLYPGVLGSHELFHLFILAGLALHWRFVWNSADWRTPTPTPTPLSAIFHPFTAADSPPPRSSTQ